VSAPVYPLTDQEQKDLIVSSVGDYNGMVAANIDSIWTMFTPYATYPPLQFLFAKRSAISLLAGQVWQAVDAGVDTVREAYSDMHKALMDQLADLDKQIALASQAAVLGAGAGAGAVSGAFTTTTPTTPPPDYPDANDPRYTGDPYQPLVFGIGRMP
jgi:hypothetical protein